jgi:hypothetical protein
MQTMTIRIPLDTHRRITALASLRGEHVQDLTDRVLRIWLSPYQAELDAIEAAVETKGGE